MSAPSESGSQRNQRAKSKGPAWMGTRAARGPNRPEAMWKPSETKKADPDSRQRPIRAGVAILALILLAGFLYVVIFPPRPTTLIALWPAAYPLSMPPIAFAEEDFQQLRKVSPSNVRVVPVELTKSAATLEEFRKQLKSAGGQFNWLQRGSNVVMIHIAAHGVLNERDEPCLVSPQADPFDSSTWVPLSDILKALREETALRGKKKLVFVDCQRVVSCWRCGWLNNRFGETLAGVVSATDDPDLYVMTAAAPGQIAWAAPEKRSSIFGHFLARALKGEGSGYWRVSLGRLFTFVAVQVDRYSQAREGLSQQPILLHVGDTYRLNERERMTKNGREIRDVEEVTVAYVKWFQGTTNWQSEFDPLADAKRLLGSPSSAGSESAGSAYTLHQVWDRYQQRRQARLAKNDQAGSLAGYVCDPIAWSSIQQRLAAVGERLWAGRPYISQLQIEIKSLGEDLDGKSWNAQGASPLLDRPQRLLAHGLELRSAGDPQPNLFDAFCAADPAKRGEVIPRTVSPERLVGDIYASLLSAAQTDDVRPRLALAAELLKLNPPADSSLDLIESHFLTLLDRGLPTSDPLAASRLAAALRGRQFAEQAANPTDRRVHYALESMVNEADEKRRAAEDLMYAGSETGEFETFSSTALGSTNPPTGYQGALEFGRWLAEYLRLRDEIWSDLPLLAEWHFVRAHLGADVDDTPPLDRLYELSIKLDECLETVMRTRDQKGGLTNQYDECKKAYDSLDAAWQDAHAQLGRVYTQTANIEQVYSRGAELRDAELTIHQPPAFGNVAPLIERYQKTLANWATPGSEIDTKGRTTAATGSEQTDQPPRRAAARSTSGASDAGESEFFRELHKALDHEFVKTYVEHRRRDVWTQGDAHKVFRAARSGDSTWNRLAMLLDTYNKDTGQELPMWDAGRQAVAAATKLRQWDCRVRVAGPWLCSFQRDLRHPNQPTPARWLQEYDAGHLTAWHAYRAYGDFWGNGLALASTNPFFAAAIGECERALLRSEMKPIRYDIPAASATTDLVAEAKAAVATLGQWQPVQFPRPNLSSQGSDNKIDVGIQPLGDTGKTLKFSPGVATLVLTTVDSPNSAAGVHFDSSGAMRRQPVAIAPGGGSPPIFTATIERSSSGSTPTGLQGRLWYRGHVRSKPVPGESSASYVQYQFIKPNYPPPTVKIEGKDTVRGAVLFIFDCSASMQGPRFEEAKKQLQEVLTDLATDAGPELHVGLWTYGTRTKAYGRETDPDLFYLFKAPPDQAPPMLTPAGKSKERELGPNRFAADYPHPDRDVSQMLAVAEGTPAQAMNQLNELASNRCIGCTPLYYAIAKAMHAGFAGLSDQAPGARQLVVISDGVNMPYDVDANGVVGSVGLEVNRKSLGELRAELTNRPGGIRVTVLLFEAKANGPLNDLVRDFPNSFEVVEVPEPKKIAARIRDSFPKTKIQLQATQGSAQPQSLSFDQVVEVKDWGSRGILRPVSETRIVHLERSGEARVIRQDLGLDLLGGEQVVLKYDSRDAGLTLADDGLTYRAYAKVDAPRGESRSLFFDALDPERTGRIVNKFYFRIRDEDQKTRFTSRPTYVWLEIRPRGIGGSAADMVFPCLDAIWAENKNLPRLQVPVERWPDCPSAEVMAWFRYDDLGRPDATIRRDDPGTSLSDKWSVEQSAARPGAARTVTVRWRPSPSPSGLDKLLGTAVWLWPPPDGTRRSYAIDGSEALHEFTYSRPDAINSNVEVRVISRDKFTPSAFSAKCDFRVAN